MAAVTLLLAGEVGAQPVSPLEVELQHLSTSEPSVQQTQEAALRAAGLVEVPDRDWGRAARRSAALPERLGIQASAQDLRGSRAERTWSEELDGEHAPEALDWRDLARADDALQLEVSVVAEWDLRGLMWNREEAWAIRESVALADRRVERMLEVAEVYYARRAALAAYLDASGTDAQRLAARLAFEQHTAQLDAWTAGWFTAQLAGAGPGAASGSGGGVAR